METPNPSNPDRSPAPSGVAPAGPSPGDLAGRLGPAGVLAAAWAILPLVCGGAVLYYANTVGQWLRAQGEIGPWVYAAGFMILSGVGILPTYASALLGGWAFGLAVGAQAAMAGFLGGAVLGYVIARGASGDRVEKLIAEQPTWRAVRDALIGGSYLKTLGIVTLVRVPPNSPFSLTNLVLASVRVPFSAYVIGTLVGMAPRTIFMVSVAAALHDKTAKQASGEKMPLWFLIAGIAIGILVLGVIGLIAQSALKRLTGGQQAGAADVGEA